MIEFNPITLEDKQLYEQFLSDGKERGCEFSFVNLYLWGQQNAVILHNHLIVLSQLHQHCFYSFPIGSGDKKPVLDAIIADAKERGIICCISGLSEDSKKTLEKLYPGMFRFHYDRDTYDYVYAIENLADLKGRKYHRKRNHYTRFQKLYPDYTVEPLNENNLPHVRQMIDAWYQARLQENPDGDYSMEQEALNKALSHYKELEMEGLLLLNGEDILAFTLGSRLSVNTFDVHFEKARWDVEGAYAAINCEFAQYLRAKYPVLEFLNREDDMGLEGLRKAKESYYPHHMIEKCRAYLTEDIYEH